MKKNQNLFTSEAVSEGHPDKVCDQIADAVLDYCLSYDESARVACEVFASTNFVLIGGEITCKVVPDYERIVKDVLTKIGYTDPKLGFSVQDVKVEVIVKQQSRDIARGVDAKKPEEIGAGDQGIMFGYASNETDGYMPLAISLAHKLVRVASSMRKAGEFLHARPDMKSQVTIDYTNSKKPRLVTVLMSVQHDEECNLNEFKKFIKEHIMKPVVASFGLNEDFEVLINPTGRFVIGGPAGDTGLTGRKLIVDTYGGASRHGGGSFSGKDPTKVDRSAAYMVRYIAKNLVAAGAADRLEVQVGYAIGCPRPLSIGISSFGTAHYSDDKIIGAIETLFDLRPGMIIEQFSLNKPSFKYEDISVYGHFGRPDIDLPWETLDKVDAVKKYLNS